MSLIRTSALNGIAVLVKMLTLLGINKILAVLVGPAGYAVVGQFQNAVQMITTFSSGAITTGVTKYTAQEADDPIFLSRLWKTAGTISILSSLFVSFLIFVFNKPLSAFFFKDSGFGDIFNWFAGLLVFFVLNSLLLAILNGKKEIKTYVTASIVGSLLSLILTSVLSQNLGLKGALIALGTYQSFAFVVTLILILNKNWFKLSDLFGAIDKGLVIKLFHYTIMALAAAICVPLSHIFLRELLIDKISLLAAGEWEAMFRLSSAYLVFVTSTLSVYFLPRIAELKTSFEIRSEIKACLKIIIPFLILATIFIYLLRLPIIDFLFTYEFRAIEQLVGIYLVGDLFKIIGWMFGYVMIAKGMTKEFVLSEIIFSTSFFILVYLLLPKFGLQATAYAHLMNYIGYSLYVYRRLVVKGIIA